MRTLKESFFGNIGIGKTGMIENWLNEMNVKNYTINKDFTIDVKGDVNLESKNITEFPEYIQFGTVKGDFYIGVNPITSLRGCPKVVNNFYCGMAYDLKSLNGAPEKINYSFYCSNVDITSLEGAPKYIGEQFICKWCTSLTTLKGAPKIVKKRFDCSCCINLKTLEGAPEKVDNFSCHFCRKLTSLKGAPKEVARVFNCSRCGKEFTVDDVKKYCNVHGNIKV